MLILWEFGLWSFHIRIVVYKIKCANTYNQVSTPLLMKSSFPELLLLYHVGPMTLNNSSRPLPVHWICQWVLALIYHPWSIFTKFLCFEALLEQGTENMVWSIQDMHGGAHLWPQWLGGWCKRIMCPRSAWGAQCLSKKVTSSSCQLYFLAIFNFSTVAPHF